MYRVSKFMTIFVIAQMSQQKDEFFKVQEKEGMEEVRQVRIIIVGLEKCMIF